MKGKGNGKTEHGRKLSQGGRGKEGGAAKKFFFIFLIKNALLQVHYDFPNAYRY